MVTFGRTREVLVTIPSTQTSLLRSLPTMVLGDTWLAPKAPSIPTWNSASSELFGVCIGGEGGYVREVSLSEEKKGL